MKAPSLVNLTLLHIDCEAVIPAPISIGVNSSGNPARKYWIPPYQVRGRLIKPGMTIKVKGLLTQDTREGREIHVKFEICLSF